jgi:hypothetical protein
MENRKSCRIVREKKTSGMMKKFFVSVGLAAAGAASVHAAYAPDSTDNSKIWTLSGTLRGFYDDNYLTTPKKVGSAGFEVSPTFSLNAPFAQTEIGIRYVYGLYFYQDRERRGQNPIDQSHEFDLWLDHAFTPRWETRFEDTVTVSQEPQLGQAGAVSVDQRVNGNNLANNATLGLHTDWTELFGTQLTYQNTFYDYQNSGGTAADASLSGLLDRDENTASIDFQWKVSPETVTFIGFQYEQILYLSNEAIAANAGGNIFASSRDNRSEFGYVGLTHQFLENLSGTFKAGLQYTTYYNEPGANNAFGPYGNASLVYTYASGSYAQVGMMETRNATDTANVGANGQPTLDQESTVVYGSIDHPLTPKLIGTLTANYQYSTYHDGQFDNQNSDFVTLGVNLSYTFTPHLSSEIGYNFDWYKTAAALQQDYNRNRVYLGITASY